MVVGSTIHVSNDDSKNIFQGVIKKFEYIDITKKKKKKKRGISDFFIKKLSIVYIYIYVLFFFFFF
jgi:hypothetical protein